MQLSTFETLHQWDFAGQNVMIGISGGINSAAVLCYLKKFIKSRPKELHLVYIDFKEHSPDTLKFVEATFDYAHRNFDNVKTHINYESALDFFKESNMIPAPAFSPCTRLLKVMPIKEYMMENKIDVDLVGYVRNEDRRIVNQIGRKLGLKKMSRVKLIKIGDLIKDMKRLPGKHQGPYKKELTLLGIKDVDQAEVLINAYMNKVSVDGQKAYPISHMDNEDCFSIVKDEIGWFPEIYDLKWNDKRLPAFYENFKHLMPEDQQIRLRNKIGSSGRIFHHNNCLPCKNMQSWEMLMVKLFYPEYYDRAIKLQQQMGASEWGRKNDSVISAELACSFCTFD